MRKKLFIKNSYWGITETIISIVCGLILPRIILYNYGSKYFGLSTSISQFLTATFLIRAGIGGASISALYEPLSIKDYDRISAILKATEAFMRKVSVIVFAVIVLSAIIYPFFVLNEFDWIFTFSLFIIMGISFVFENLLGITYSCLIVADQKIYFTSIIRIICAIANTMVAYYLISVGAGFRVVKLATTIIYLMYPIAIWIFVHKTYPIKVNVNPDFIAVNQRWAAFWYQTAEFVTNNTDIVILTIFSNVLEVSVYSVYAMILTGLRRLIEGLNSGLEAAFGEIIANGQDDLLKKRMCMAETVLIAICTIMYSTAWIMIFDFIEIYTRGVKDTDYQRQAFATVMIFAYFFWNIRKIYDSIVRAAGRYKETKKIVMIEPIVNIVVSTILVIRMGIIGVAIGTLFATFYRCAAFSYYTKKNIVHISKNSFYIKVFEAVVEGVIILIFARLTLTCNVTNFSEWGVKACCAFVESFVVVLLGQYMCNKTDIQNMLKWIKMK